jgi:methylated-DNA-protein-cysteine methyltransferase related protein
MPLKKQNTKSKKFEDPKNFYEAVYRLVNRIPKGRLMSYGQIATLLGAPRASRAVGYAMRACPEGLPWQRVINAKAQISARGDVERPILQRLLLEDEGIEFSLDDTCDLDRLRWEPINPDKYVYEISDDLPFT